MDTAESESQPEGGAGEDGEGAVSWVPCHMVWCAPAVLLLLMLALLALVEVVAVAFILGVNNSSRHRLDPTLQAR